MGFDIYDYVISVLSRRSGIGISRISTTSRIVQDLKIDGDDAIDALLEISKHLQMDLSDFDATLYFHQEPNIFSIFRTKRPQKKDITVEQILEGARRGRLS